MKLIELDYDEAYSLRNRLDAIQLIPNNERYIKHIRYMLHISDKNGEINIRYIHHIRYLELLEYLSNIENGKI